MELVKPPFWDGKSLNLPPVFNWGGRIGAAPPQQRYPGWLNINRTQDVAVSMTKVAGRHTIKGGYYLNHSFKAQKAPAAAGWLPGHVNFGNDTQQHPRLRVRLRERGAGDLHAVHAEVDDSSKAACCTTRPSSSCRTTGR